MINGIENLEQKLIVILAGDVAASAERQKATPSQHNNRNLVRTIFAAIEGIVSIFRDHVTDIATELGELSSAEVAALAESVFQISNTGKVSAQRRFVPFLPMLRLLFRISARMDSSLAVSFADGNWENVRIALAVRNRITHPKASSDLSVSQDDVQVSFAAYYWLLERTAEAMASANAAFAAHVEQFRTILEALKAGDPEMVAAYETVARGLDI